MPTRHCTACGSNIWRDRRLSILTSFFIVVALIDSTKYHLKCCLSVFLTGIINSQDLLVQSTLSSKETLSTKLAWRCSHTFCFPISISWVVPPSRSISFAATSIMCLISALFSGHADTLWIATHSARRCRQKSSRFHYTWTMAHEALYKYNTLQFNWYCFSQA